MAKIDQKQVVDFLHTRKQELHQELNKIETALSALQEPAAPKRKYTRRSPAAKQITTSGRAKATRGPKEQSQRKSPQTVASTSLPPLDDRLIQLLSQIGPASKSAIIQELTARYPNEAHSKISRGAALRLTVMAKIGKLQSKKQDDQVIYSVSG